MNTKALVATGMIVVPLLVAAGTRLWVSGQQTPAQGISDVIVLPARVFGVTDRNYLSDAVAEALFNHLAKVEGMESRIGKEDETSDAFVLSTITADSGALQLNLEIIDRKTQRVIWRNPYQAPESKYLEMIRAAGEGLRSVLRPTSSPVRSFSGVSQNSEAELAFREAMYYRTSDPERSAAAFKRASQIDPSLSASKP